MEDFIKALYTSFIGCLSQVFSFGILRTILITYYQELQTCVKLFSLATQGDDWVTPILGKLDSLNTLVYNYKLKHTFIQVQKLVLSDLYLSFFLEFAWGHLRGH